MADSAISGLTAFGEAPEGTDLMEGVDLSEPVVADRSKKLTFTNLFDMVLTYDGDILTYDGDVLTL